MKHGALRIGIIYILTSLLWIGLSDRILYLFHNTLNPQLYFFINSGKGFFFVIVTGILVYKLICIDKEKLTDSELKYRNMYESNPTPMWIYDMDTLKFLSVNDAAIKTYGYTREEFLSMTILCIRPPQDEKKLREKINRLSGGYNDPGLWRHIKKDGSTIHVNISSHVSIINKKHVVVLVRDVTDNILFKLQLEQLNTDLQIQKERLSETQQISKVAGWDFFLEDKQLVWSDEFYMITGTQPDPGKSPFDIYVEHIHPEDRPLMINGIEMLITEGKKLDVIHRIIMPNGQLRYIRQLARAEFKDGKPYKVIGSMQDITELKMAELERKRADDEIKRLAGIMTMVNNMIIITDKDNLITWINKALEDHTGFKFIELAGKNPSEMLSGPDTDRIVLQTILQKKKLLEVFSLDIGIYTKCGEHFWVSGEFTPLFDEHDDYTGYIAVYNNITSRKEKEEEIIRQNDKLREVAWLSSHEVRRPLANIMGLVDLIRHTADVTEKVEIMERVNRSAKELDKIVHIINSKIINEFDKDSD